MIAIPNMDKPKRGEVIAFDGENAVYTDDDMNVHRYPLIDIVRCGECKYMRKYALRSDEPTGIWCHRWSVPRLVTDDGFCSYGERRT